MKSAIQLPKTVTQLILEEIMRGKIVGPRIDDEGNVTVVVLMQDGRELSQMEAIIDGLKPYLGGYVITLEEYKALMKGSIEIEPRTFENQVLYKLRYKEEREKL